MDYSEKYRELVELSHSDNTAIKEKADAWLSASDFREQPN